MGTSENTTIATFAIETAACVACQGFGFGFGFSNPSASGYNRWPADSSNASFFFETRTKTTTSTNMGLFGKLVSNRSGAVTAPPPKYEACEKLEKNEAQAVVNQIPAKDEGPMVELKLYSVSFQIPVRILEEKAPKLLKEYRTSEKLVSYHKVDFAETDKKACVVLAHWLHHGTLPEFDIGGLNDSERKQLLVSLPTVMLLAGLYAFAQDCGIVHLEDSITDAFSTASSWDFRFTAESLLYCYTSSW